jgi:hypothetical protein
VNENMIETQIMNETWLTYVNSYKHSDPEEVNYIRPEVSQIFMSKTEKPLSKNYMLPISAYLGHFPF